MYKHEPYRKILETTGVDVTHITRRGIEGNKELFGTMRVYSTLAGQEVRVIETTDSDGAVQHHAFTESRIDSLHAPYRLATGEYELPKGSRVITTDSILGSLPLKKPKHHTLR